MRAVNNSYTNLSLKDLVWPRLYALWEVWKTECWAHPESIGTNYREGWQHTNPALELPHAIELRGNLVCAVQECLAGVETECWVRSKLAPVTGTRWWSSS